MTYVQFQDWRKFYDAEPWGEQREDLRQAVLLRYLLKPYEKHTTEKLPDIMWPYFNPETGENTSEMLAFMESFDAALVPKEGGGYVLTETIETIIEAANDNRRGNNRHRSDDPPVE